MALVRCGFFSEVLLRSTSMTVILPERTTHQIGMEGRARSWPPPVLYLLHGLSDDDTIWTRRTSIERYAAAAGLAVVMPQVDRSFYTDMVHGGRYWTFLSEELPATVGQFFQVSDRRKDTFVAGLSMGGYGALKWALRCPDRFAAAAGLSGAPDVCRMRRENSHPGLFDHVFGDRDIEGTDDDLLHLLDTADPQRLPRLFTCCGTEDSLLQDNDRFAARAAERGVGLKYETAPGDHEWGFWDTWIARIIPWLLQDLTS
jgi:putative tributyrin esterase